MKRALLFLATGLVACSDVTTEANFTGGRINIVSPTPIQIESLQLSGMVGMEPAFEPSPRTIPLRTDETMPPPPFRKKVLAVVIDERFVGGKLALLADAIDAQGAIIASGSTEVSLSLGALTTSTITLAMSLSCGDGRLDAGEGCDDGGSMIGDGCDARCKVETDFVCAGAPSECSPIATTAIVDAEAACPGTGTVEAPFCTMGRAFDVPWPEVVLIRAGAYDERVEIDRNVKVIAEAGAVLSETTPPVLTISAGEVEITGLAVQGGSRSIGGGIEVRGAQTQATLHKLSIGPGTGVGLTADNGAFLELTMSRISRQLGGGLRIGDVSGYIVENNLIVENGDERAELGGARIDRAPVGSFFAFNTVAANAARTSSTAGIFCVDRTTPIGATLVWDNGDVTDTIANRCSYDYSDLGPLAPNVTIGGTNFSEDPDFDATYHLGPSSGCVDRADPSSAFPERDYDGQARPIGPGPDVGADERG
jgi:cysteine-rich repeat protein